MAYTDREDLNYLGILYRIGANRTPFLNAIGGLQNTKTCNSFAFPIAQAWSLAGASQPAITEAASITAPTATTYTRAQDYNTVQIFQKQYSVTYAKQSTFRDIGGLSQAGEPIVTDEVAFQRNGALQQLAVDVEFTFLQGAYQAASNSSTAAKSRGLKNAISTNTVAASAALLTKAMIDTLLKTMADNGAIFSNMMALVNSYQLKVLSDIYGYAPADRNVGGVAIEQIVTPYGKVGVMYAPYMPTDELYLTEMSVCKPMICPVGGQLVVDEELAKVGAAMSGQIYSQIGLDYGPEEFHGSITGLKNT
jgi:hypothetical protein